MSQSPRGMAGSRYGMTKPDPKDEKRSQQPGAVESKQGVPYRRSDYSVDREVPEANARQEKRRRVTPLSSPGRIQNRKHASTAFHAMWVLNG